MRWGYALLAHAPESSDSAFTWGSFQSCVNKDLADKFGNFVNRVLKMTENWYASAIPHGGALAEPECELGAQCAALINQYTRQMQAIEFTKAIQSLRALWSAGNAYVDARAPWKLSKTDPEMCAMVIRTCLNLAALYAVWSWPVIPFACERVWSALELRFDERAQLGTDEVTLSVLPIGRKVNMPGILFQKIDPLYVARWEQQFGH